MKKTTILLSHWIFSTKRKVLHFYFLILVVLLGNIAKAGLYYEHKKSGDLAMLEWIQNPEIKSFLLGSLGFKTFGGGDCNNYPIPYRHNGELISYYCGLPAIGDSTQFYTYGDFCGLAGDHSLDYMQLFDGLLHKQIFTGAPSGSRYAALVGYLELIKNKQQDALDENKKETSYLYFSYITLANEDRSHFQSPPNDRIAMLRAISPLLIECLDSLIQIKFTKANDSLGTHLRRVLDSCFLQLNNTAKYAILHIIAMSNMENAAVNYSNHDKEGAKVNVIIALIINAFADHFLQDAFAAGHIPVHRTNFGMDNKGVHDYYCRIGLDLRNPAGDCWHSFGDGYYDSTTFSQVIKAGLQSLMDLWEHFRSTYHYMQTHALPEPSPFRLLYQIRSNSDSVNALIFIQCKAFYYIPYPLTPEEYAGIELKHASKPGAYLDLSLMHYLSGDGNNGFQVGLSALSFNLSKYNSEDSGRHFHGDRRETILWAGGILAFNFSYMRFNGRNIETMMGSVFNLTWRDWLALDCKLGGQLFDDKVYFIVRSQIGYEWHKIGFPLAPSLKFFYDLTAAPLPVTGLMLSIRIY